MLKRFRFKTQVMVLPIVAAIAFIALAAVSVSLGLQSGNALQRIDREFSPAEKQSQGMLDALFKIQRSLQDAASALDYDMLREADLARSEFLELIASAKQNPSLNSKEIERLQKAFEQYYQIATDTSRRMIAQDDSENLSRSIQTMGRRYLSIKDKLEKQVQKSEENTRRFLVALAQSAAQRPSYTNIPIIAVALFIIIVLARSVAAGTVKSLSEAAQHLAAASSELLALAEQTESNMANEASSVDETRQTMEGMLGAANEVGQGADSVVESADRSVAASRTIGERINKLNVQAMKISDISETVRAIADKSDILALNASLEGTKAGEVGRGFALVGAEMRRLTETVMDAVREIKQLATQIQELSQAAVLASEDGQKLAVETTETARRITLIATQQRTATVQVTRAMDDIQDFTQQAVSGAKQAKETANDLVRTANNLTGLLRGVEAHRDGFFANDVKKAA